MNITGKGIVKVFLGTLGLALAAQPLLVQESAPASKTVVVVQAEKPAPKPAKPVKHIAQGQTTSTTLKSRESVSQPQESGCNVTAQIQKARDLTGEHEARVQWVTRTEAEAKDMGSAAAWAEDGVVTVVTDTVKSCSTVTMVLAHEFYHEAQFRMVGGLAKVYDYYGSADAVEHVAQCAAVSLPIKTYMAYEISDTENCSPQELAQAETLTHWTR